MTDHDQPGMRAHLPAIGALLERPDVRNALAYLPRTVVVDALRTAAGAARQAISDGHAAPSGDAIAASALEAATALATPTVVRVINATGVVLHTGLGRAPLSREAQDAIGRAAAGHCVLETDLISGNRGSRQVAPGRLLRHLTGAEASLVVNNNAGAVLLSVMALASGREVIVSRGELVEIGGAFRMPDIVRAAGAALVEVGTTNRTRASDYSAAITARTALVLRCHPSNFVMTGFTTRPELTEVVEVAHSEGIPVIEDLGSGALLPIAGVATVTDALGAGADLVTASGDKLLGGPQAGLVLGSKKCIDALAGHPVARALRPCKLTIAALEATLLQYLRPDEALAGIPTLRALNRTAEELRRHADRLSRAIRRVVAGRVRVSVIESESATGGGSLPGVTLLSWCVALEPHVGGPTLAQIASRLRRGDVAVVGRIRGNQLLLDPRTLLPDEDRDLVEAVRQSVG